MPILIIDSVEESTQACKLHISKLRDHFNTGQELEAEAAIQAVAHYHKHNCAATISNLKEAFADYASKEGLAAFKYLATYFTGATKDNKKDETRHNKAVPLYMAELNLIDNLGLPDWHKVKIGESNGTLRRQAELASAKSEDDKTVIMERHAEEIKVVEDKKDADKAENAKKKAIAWFEEAALLDPIAAKQLSYIKGIAELSYRDSNTADDIHTAVMGKITISLTASLSKCKSNG